LPLISTTGTATETVPATETEMAATAAATAETPGPSAPLPQVQGFAGTVQADSGAIWLRWQPVAAQSGSGNVEGYRLYRALRSEENPEFVQIVELTDGSTAFVDHEPVCDGIYMVTAFSAAGESPMSAASYYAPACR
jgi:hypothetical protein